MENAPCVFSLCVSGFMSCVHVEYVHCINSIEEKRNREREYIHRIKGSEKWRKRKKTNEWTQANELYSARNVNGDDILQ